MFPGGCECIIIIINYMSQYHIRTMYQYEYAGIWNVTINNHYFILRLFFLATATLYLTAQALAQDYRPPLPLVFAPPPLP